MFVMSLEDIMLLLVEFLYFWDDVPRGGYHNNTIVLQYHNTTRVFFLLKVLNGSSPVKFHTLTPYPENDIPWREMVSAAE